MILKAFDLMRGFEEPKNFSELLYFFSEECLKENSPEEIREWLESDFCEDHEMEEGLQREPDYPWSFPEGSPRKMKRFDVIKAITSTQALSELLVDLLAEYNSPEALIKRLSEDIPDEELSKLVVTSRSDQPLSFPGRQ